MLSPVSTSLPSFLLGKEGQYLFLTLYKHAYSVLYQLCINLSNHLAKFKHFNDKILLRYRRFSVFDTLSASFFSLRNPKGPKISTNMHILYYISYVSTLATIWWGLSTSMTSYCFDIGDFLFLTPFQPLFCLFCISRNIKGPEMSTNMHILYYFSYVSTLATIWWSLSTSMASYCVNIGNFS